MNCANIQKLLHRSLDNESTDEQTHYVEEHLRTCTQCQRYYNEIKLLKTNVEALNTKTVSPAFVESMTRALLDEERTPERGLVFEMGNLSKRLLPYPVLAMLIVSVLVVSLQSNTVLYTNGEYDELSETETLLFSDESISLDTAWQTVMSES